MKNPIVFALFAFLVPATDGEEKGTARVVPQPRVRLDHAMVAKAEALAMRREGESDDVEVMAPVVVTERSVQRRPMREEEPKGKFTPTGGGLFLKEEVGRTGVEMGIRPYVDIMENEFTPPKKRVDWELVRIGWK